MEVNNVETGAVDIFENTFNFLLECKEKGEVLSKQAPASVYRVPSVVRDLSPSSFNPTIVAIGPLHSQDKNLQRFEVLKMTYLHNLLSRFGCASEKTLRECARKVIRSIESIKAFYAGSTICNDFKLAKMMVIDACFILEFIQCISDASAGKNLLIARNVINDMLLIENQIPFFVLKIIYECTISASGRMPSGASLTTQITVLLKYYKIFDENLLVPDVSLASTHDHILDFVHKCYQPAEPMPSDFISNPKCHSAIELHRAGINFKPNEDPNWAMAIKLELPSPSFSWMAFPPFSWFSWPTLRIPKVTIGDSTELILRNLIVYEQFSEVKNYVTSYVCAMDFLIDTPEDVALLVKSKVLNNYLGSNEVASNMFNSLGKEVMVAHFVYLPQWKEMDVYYNSYWPNTMAGLKQTYFSNPWSILALIAAFLLFALTVVQTSFTIKAA